MSQLWQYLKNLFSKSSTDPNNEELQTLREEHKRLTEELVYANQFMDMLLENISFTELLFEEYENYLNSSSELAAKEMVNRMVSDVDTQERDRTTDSNQIAERMQTLTNGSTIEDSKQEVVFSEDNPDVRRLTEANEKLENYLSVAREVLCEVLTATDVVYPDIQTPVLSEFRERLSDLCGTQSEVVFTCDRNYCRFTSRFLTIAWIHASKPHFIGLK